MAPLRERLRKILPARAPQPISDQQGLDWALGHLKPAARDFAQLAFQGGENLFAKEQRSIVPEVSTSYSGSLEHGIVEPPYDPFMLELIYSRHWVVRLCIDKITRESTRNGYRFEPKWKAKCAKEDLEFEYYPLSGKCPNDGSEIIDPDPSQLKRVEKWIDACNPRWSFMDIVKRNIRDLLTFDDFYVSYSKSTTVSNPVKIDINIEDVKYMGMVTDKQGNLGNHQLFCPTYNQHPGYSADGEIDTYPDDGAQTTCPVDKTPMKEIAYVQRLGKKIVGAWSEDEIVHDNLFGIGNRLYGTPKIWALQPAAMTMLLMDIYQKDSFDKAKTPKNIFVVKGIDDNSLSRQLRQMEEIKKINPMADMWIAVPNLPAAGPGLGSQVGIEKIVGIDDPLIKGMLPFQEFYFKEICYTFGVSPASVGVETAGRLGGNAASGQGSGGSSGRGAQTGGQTGVTPETINEVQIQISETWDKEMKKLFPELKDWKFSLVTAHEDEEMVKAGLQSQQADAAQKYVTAGLDILIDEDGSLIVTGSNTQEDRDKRQAQTSAMSMATSASHATSIHQSFQSKSTSVTKSFDKGNPSYVIAPAPHITNNVPEAQLQIQMKPETYLSILGYDTPEDFKSDSKYFDSDSYKHLKYRMQNNKELNPIVLWLKVDGTKITPIKHNGRHRALVAHDLGIDKIPVVVHLRDSDSYPISTGDLSPIQRGKIDEMLTKAQVGGFTPPSGIGAVGAKVYASCRQRWVSAHPGDRENAASKTSCAKIAWTAQNRAKSKDDDIQKAVHEQAIIQLGAEEYRKELDALSRTLYHALRDDFSDVLDVALPSDNVVTPDLKITLLKRERAVLDQHLDQAVTVAHGMNQRLYKLGNQDGYHDLMKQEDPNLTPIDDARTIQSMQNVLYFGDKDSYLQTINDLIDQGINENWTPAQLSKALQEQLDPDQEHFSKYMWDRIARTESASYVTEGRLDAYDTMQVPMVRRIVASDASDELCAPYADVVYKVEDAYDVIPAHPNCRCAFAPYFGDEEPIDALDIPLT